MKKVSYDKFDEYASTFMPGFNDLEERLARREAMAVKLAGLLNAKIDECEALKSEIARLNNLLNCMPLADHVDTTGGEWAWEE